MVAMRVEKLMLARWMQASVASMHAVSLRSSRTCCEKSAKRQSRCDDAQLAGQ